MTKPSPIAALLPLLIPALLLAACGRTEPVEDLPTQEELAAAANAAAAQAAANLAAEPPAAARNYENMARGFAITVPEGWMRDEAASSADGVVYADPGAGADIRVFWDANSDDGTLQQVVEAVNAGSGAVAGDFVSDREYRGTANDGEGNTVSLRLLKQPSGGIVTATLVYPEQLSEQYKAIADETLDSLRVFPPRDAAPAAGTNETASNAAE